MLICKSELFIGGYTVKTQAENLFFLPLNLHISMKGRDETYI